MVRLRLLAGLSLLFCFPAVSQTLPILDQNPTSLRWYRLSTPHFRVLYPAGFDTTAQRTAQRLEQLYEPVSASLNRRPRRVSVLLQNQTTVSNGFVTLLPRRSEFFASPPQDPGLLGTFDWLDLLAVHEYRHVVQAEKALQHYGRVLFALFGNAGLTSAYLTVPDWFAEGDAVSTETLLSTGGRGRIPNFDLGMRANLLAGRQFPYAKAVSGSFRDNVPNHYVLGYFMTTYLKRAKGPEAWSDILNRNYRRVPWPFAFSASVKDQTGLRVDDLYRKTMDDLTETWRTQQKNLTLSPVSPYAIAPPEKAGQDRPVFTSYRYPQFITDSSVIAVKSGLGDTPRLVLLSNNGSEQLVHVQGFPNDPAMLSATAQRVCWIEYGYDPRWGQRVYSNIRLLDLASRQLTRLTHRTRYTAVALSPDNQKLIVVENTDTYKTRLHVLDAQTGRQLATLPNPDDAFYLHPRWAADNQTIVTVKLKNGYKTLQAVDTRTGLSTDLLPAARENISHPQPWSDYVFYNSPRSGIDNVYAVNTKTKQVFQVTSRPLAAYHAAVSPSGGKLAVEEFTADGYRIVDMPLAPSRWTALSASAPAGNPAELVRYFGALPQLEPGAVLGRQILNDSLAPTQVYTPTRFRRLAHALNVYNWGPIVSSTGQALNVGLSSQDLLSTTQVSVGYTYNQAERVGNAYALLSYQGLYPIIDVSFQRGNRNTSLYIDRAAPVDSLRSDRWQYNQLTAGFRLPLQFTQSKYSQAASMSAYYNYLAVTDYDLPFRSITEVGGAGSLNALSYAVSYSRLLRQSKRDVAPRWGQTLSATYRHTPFGGRLQAEQWGVQGNLFVPGLGKHHSLRLRGGFQQQSRGTYRFAPVVFYPRGQAYVSDDQILAGSAEYRLPIADTHWSLGRWLYVQRIKAAGFMDAAQGQSRLEVRTATGQLRGYQTRTNQYQTAGVDVSFIVNALRLRTPFEVGARGVYNLTTGQWLVQPLVVDIGF
ncbi:TolB-like translocation protein [Spirosoma sordidisoli]|uniref:Uncharacterized protein n=1 Tax=Spirosoma sordidisoli TaxID=2502893 RepID=A0A4Q2UJL1_9BACT|nr:hypothetical protein [Spirosoma sordidisoli]RYC69424.1 hypothetical protein EQG79_12515 [Spirosoma sordidisoli]